MTHPDPDPLDVTPADSRLLGFREQRRRSRWNCSVALVALTLACLVFWAAVLFVAVNVFAAPRNAPVQLAQSGAPHTVWGITSTRLAPGESGGAPQTASIGPDRGSAGPLADRPPRGGNQSKGSGAAVSSIRQLSALTYTGELGYALPSHGSRYLAIRWPRGTVATLCGPADCVTRESTDFGPVRSLWEAGRLADLSAVDWKQVCGAPLRFGLCDGTLLIVSRPRALPETDTAIATSGFGMHGAPRLSMTATCRNSGHQSVWVAQTGTASLDIIQVGTMDGEFFYAYGRGVPNGAGSLYVEEHLGPSGTGPHRYGLSLAARVWTLTIDGRTVATVPDTFRTWRLRATQVMAEGDLPFGAASCSFPAGSWSFGGYGPQPPNSFSATSWRVPS